MKRKIFSILFALVLVLSFSLIPAMPVMAAPVTQTVTGDGAGGFDLAQMDQQFSAVTIDASTGDTILSGEVTLGNFEAGNGNDVWYEAGLVSNATYLGYSRLHNKGVYMIALWDTSGGYYKVHMQNVPGYENPPAVGNYLGDEPGYVDLWGDAGLCYLKVPSATFQYEIKYHGVTANNGNFDLRISVDGGTTWSSWKYWQYAENDAQVQYGWTDEEAVAYGYAGDDNLTNARVVSQIFVCSTTTETFTADYDNIQINGTSYALAPRVLNTNTGKGYAGIQVAIDDAATGTTINVAAGTYTEYLHITTDNLAIEGAGIDQSIIDLDGLTPYWHYSGVSSSYASRAGVLISGYGSPDEIVENVTFKGFTVKNAGLNPPTTATGNHTDSDNAAILTDSTASWTPGALVGEWVHNVDDRDSDYEPARSYGQITANTATTVTATLSGGMENDWDSGDTYVITTYEHFFDQYGDGQEDVRGIGIGNGKNILIQNNKVINNGYGGITVGKARGTGLKLSEGVTIDSNISSDHPVAGIGVGDYVGPVTITNNTLENNKRPHLADPTREYSGYGIQVAGKSSSETLSGVISNNIISNNGFEGIIVTKYTDGVTVENNTVTGHNFDQDGAGIFFYHWGHPEYCKNHIIRNNTVTGNIRGIVAYYASNSTIENNTITTDSGTFDSGQGAIKLDYANNIEVKDNNINSGEGVGIRVTSSDSHDNTFTGNTVNGAMFAGVYITSGAYDNTFTSNTITGTTSATFTQYADWGSHDGGSGQAVLTDSTKSWTPDAFVGFTLINTSDGSSGTITANTETTVTATLSNGTENDWDTDDEYDITFDETQADGVFLRGGNCKDSLHAGTGNVFHNNDIYGNAGDGMENQTTTTADATRNWWGSAAGPRHATTNPGDTAKMGNAVSDNVDYAPWLYLTTVANHGDTVAHIVANEVPAYAQSVVLDGSWNAFSVPIGLDGQHNTWKELYDLTNLDYAVAYRFDPATQTFVALATTTEYAIAPGEGFYIKMNSDGSLPYCYSTQFTIPSRDLKAGWNLIGGGMDTRPEVDSCISIATTGSTAGYTHIISPQGNTSSWVYIAEAASTHNFVPGEGYWVFMAGDRTLGLFDPTPVAWVAP